MARAAAVRPSPTRGSAGDNVINLQSYVKQPEAPVGTGSGGGGGDLPPPPAWERKRTNKRINEQLKLFGSGMNTLAAGVLGSSIIVPLIQKPEAFVENYNPAWFLAGVGLHLVGQITLGMHFRSEE